MEGILLVLAVMLLFALIATNRFKMLRKMADKVFEAFQEEAKSKYEALDSLLQEAGKKGNTRLKEEDFDQLRKLLQQEGKPGLSIDEQVALENRISRLEGSLFGFSATEGEQRGPGEHTESAYRHARKKTDALKKQYNDTVVHYNNAVFLFPSNVFALIFGFKRRKPFDLDRENADSQPLKDK